MVRPNNEGTFGACSPSPTRPDPTRPTYVSFLAVRRGHAAPEPPATPLPSVGGPEAREIQSAQEQTMRLTAQLTTARAISKGGRS